tara:strand:- start:258 stop:785 length:528 start_codon:yes stop_codon:yes gene_type:complete
MRDLDFNEELILPSGDTRSIFEKPVPGQSLTDEPGIYPWDKPPKYTNIDDVMEMYMSMVTDDNSMFNLLNALEAKIPLTQIVQAMVLQGVGEGLYTPDLGLLIMDELVMLISNIAKAANMEVVTGHEKEIRDNMARLASARNELLNINPETLETAKQAVEEKAGGLMSKPEPMEE